jgi:hypothetical protein
MTIRIYEVTEVECDECGDSTSARFSSEYENVHESEMYWFDDLQMKGWIYDKENDSHYCPTCSDIIKNGSEYDE